MYYICVYFDEEDNVLEARGGGPVPYNTLEEQLAFSDKWRERVSVMSRIGARRMDVMITKNLLDKEDEEGTVEFELLSRYSNRLEEEDN